MNEMCTTLGVPDDVAGATFMAAGASSPELFTALIAQFITKSDVGLGAVVGSEVFNMLIICACSAIYADGGRVQLDWKILSRDLVFYFLSCALLLYSAFAIKCTKLKVPGSTTKYCDQPDLKEHIDIVWWESLSLFLLYIVYALVCSFYNSHIMPALCGAGGGDADAADDDAANYKELEDASHQEEGGTTFGNASDPTWEGPKPGAASFVGDTGGKPGAASFMSAGNGKPRAASFLSGNRSKSFLANPAAASFVSTGGDILLSVMPSTLAGEARIAADLQSEGHMKDTLTVAGEMSCFLQKKSRFYSGSRVFLALAWRLRWCTIGKEDFTSCTGFQEGSLGDDAPPKLKFMNIYEATEAVVVKEKDNQFKLCMPGKRGDRIFRAQTRASMLESVRRLNGLIEKYKQLGEDERRQLWATKKVMHGEAVATADGADMDDAPEHDELLAWPTSLPVQLVHLLLLPLKVPIYYSITDVRKTGGSGYKSALAMSVVWMVACSYVMTIALSFLGEFFRISDVTMGITLGAAGTSFPNVLASVLVAKQGQGNMAVCAAFGANVFNILVGLGMTWLLYNAFVGEYTLLQRQGVLVPLLILVISLVAFVLVVALNKWVINIQMGYAMIALYVAYVTCAVVGVWN
jgi:K+-dependent Na+/Ca+ exchanger-like protein